VGFCTEVFNMPKYATKLPILVSAQEEYYEGGRRSFDTEIRFLGKGYLTLRIPESVVLQAIHGVVRVGATLELTGGIVFQGVQVVPEEDG
jgi:hypothetical protein